MAQIVSTSPAALPRPTFSQLRGRTSWPGGPTSGSALPRRWPTSAASASPSQRVGDRVVRVGWCGRRGTVRRDVRTVRTRRSCHRAARPVPTSHGYVRCSPRSRTSPMTSSGTTCLMTPQSVDAGEQHPVGSSTNPKTAGERIRKGECLTTWLGQAQGGERVPRVQQWHRALLMIVKQISGHRRPQESVPGPGIPARESVPAVELVGEGVGVDVQGMSRGGRREAVVGVRLDRLGQGGLVRRALSRSQSAHTRAIILISTSCAGKASRGVPTSVLATCGSSRPYAALRTGPAT